MFHDPQLPKQHMSTISGVQCKSYPILTNTRNFRFNANFSELVWAEFWELMGLRRLKMKVSMRTAQIRRVFRVGHIHSRSQVYTKLSFSGNFSSGEVPILWYSIVCNWGRRGRVLEDLTSRKSHPKSWKVMGQPSTFGICAYFSPLDGVKSPQPTCLLWERGGGSVRTCLWYQVRTQGARPSIPQHQLASEQVFC